MSCAARGTVCGIQASLITYGSASMSTMMVLPAGLGAGVHLNSSMENFLKTSPTQGREKDTLNQAWASAI